MPIVPAAWMPKASMKRIITHWTAGGYTATTQAKSHYHILIDGDCKLHRGSHTIADNESTKDGVYAAHTKGTNTGSIGITVCCMVGAQQKPFKGGSAPMKQEQWVMLARVAADLCSHYNIAVTKQTVLGHGEVQKTLGIAQNGKWDPMVKPWDTGKTIEQVGDEFRDMVQTWTAVNSIIRILGF